MLADYEKNLNNAAAASPHTVTLGGRTFVVPPLKLSDFFAQRNKAMELCFAASRDPIDTVNEKIQAAEKAGKPYSPTMVKMLTDSALSAATSKERKQTPTEQQLAEKLQHPEFIRWWLWFVVRKADANITPDEVNALIGPTDDDALNATHSVAALMQSSLAGLNPN